MNNKEISILILMNIVRDLEAGVYEFNPGREELDTLDKKMFYMCQARCALENAINSLHDGCNMSNEFMTKASSFDERWKYFWERVEKKENAEKPREIEEIRHKNRRDIRIANAMSLMAIIISVTTILFRLFGG